MSLQLGAISRHLTKDKLRLSEDVEPSAFTGDVRVQFALPGHDQRDLLRLLSGDEIEYDAAGEPLGTPKVPKRSDFRPEDLDLTQPKIAKEPKVRVTRAEKGAAPSNAALAASRARARRVLATDIEPAATSTLKTFMKRISSSTSVPVSEPSDELRMLRMPMPGGGTVES